MTVADSNYLAPEALSIGDWVQPHGALLVLAGSPLVAVRASVNAPEVLGLPGDALGSAIADCFAGDTAGFWQSLSALSVGEFLYGTLGALTGGHFHATAHRNADSVLVLELEPRPPHLPRGESHRDALRGALAALHRATGWQDLVRAAAAEVQALTGCDRVMVYRFDPTGAGEVIAESRHHPDIGESYLGLHYPAEDIPAAARAAYQHCPLRYIADFTAEPVPLDKSDHAAEPLNLEWALLRYPSTCCCEYHTRLGAQALLVLPLLQSGQLWGLVSCHHSRPHHLAPETRTDCELLAQFLALELADRRNRAERDYELKLQVLRAEAIADLACGTGDLQTALLADGPRLLALTGATGAAVCLEGKIAPIGRTPDRAAIENLLAWAQTSLDADEPLLVTDRLPVAHPEAAAYADVASGLLLLRISALRHWAILWFRPEVPETVTWAGNPSQVIENAPLGPRMSFARWQQTKRGIAKPWQPEEIRSARELCNAIASLVLEKTDELERSNRELERSNRELAAFAFAASHDLKEPLRGIHNYATFLLEDYAERLDETGRDRLQVLVRLSQRMENLIDVLLYYSRLGQTELDAKPTDLNELVTREIELFNLSRPQAGLEFRRPRPLPVVSCNPTLVRELLGNLITNACKYNERDRPWIEIGYLAPAERAHRFPERGPHGPVLFYVRDNGIGIQPRHQEAIFRLFKRLHSRDRYGGGTGAGLAIARRIVERHDGQIWVESIPGEGSTFYFDLGLER